VPAGAIALVPLLWLFVSFTAKPLHPEVEMVPTVKGAAPAAKWASAVELAQRAVRASVAEQNLPGLSVAVGLDGEVVWAEGFGLADLPRNVQVTPEHKFRIGRLSEALTSAAAGLLLEGGKLKLEDEIQSYVPKFPRKDVTLGQLMAHNPGTVPDDNDEGALYRKHCGRPAELLEHYSHSWFTDVDGVRDSVYDYVLVSAAIEAAAGKPFLEFIRERVFEPVGMPGTVADTEVIDFEGEDFPPFIMIRELIYDPTARRGSGAVPKDVKQDRAMPYVPRMGSNPKRGMHSARMFDLSCYAGASVFVSTPSDLVRFGMAMQTGKLLKPATVQLLQAPQSVQGERGIAMGWEVTEATLAGKKTQVVGLNGRLFGGQVASLMTFPRPGMVVAVTSNISHADTASIGVKVAEIFASQR
jgi:CubicO group peptidase (beta-lactamase class C family)